MIFFQELLLLIAASDGLFIFPTQMCHIETSSLMATNVQPSIIHHFIQLISCFLRKHCKCQTHSTNWFVSVTVNEPGHEARFILKNLFILIQEASVDLQEEEKCRITVTSCFELKDVWRNMMSCYLCRLS